MSGPTMSVCVLLCVPPPAQSSFMQEFSGSDAWMDLHANIHPYAYITHTHEQVFFFHSFCDYRFHQICPQSDSVSSLLQEWTRNTATLPPPPHFPLWSCALYKMTQSTATATVQTGKPLAVYTTCTGSEGLDVYSVKHGLKMLDLQNKSAKTKSYTLQKIYKFTFIPFQLLSLQWENSSKQPPRFSLRLPHNCLLTNANWQDSAPLVRKSATTGSVLLSFLLVPLLSDPLQSASWVPWHSHSLASSSGQAEIALHKTNNLISGRTAVISSAQNSLAGRRGRKQGENRVTL